MKKNDKIFAMAVVLIIATSLYSFLFPNRNWFGKPYLNTTNKEGFAVVELFTSEGCSSCPPADALLARFQKQSEGKNIFFLAYHVDYWDRQGWKDQFSAPEFTERQEQYRKQLRNEVLYTPQFIVNGTSEFAGDEERTLYQLVSDALNSKTEATINLTSEEQYQLLNIGYKVDNTNKNNSLLIALVQKEASTYVKRGENSGRQLHHVQIVKEFTTLSLDKTEGIITMSKPESFNKNNWELIAFIQNKSTGKISAATKINL